MTAMKTREIHLARRPEGLLGDVFKCVTVDLRTPSAGDVLVRNRWMSVDPYMRARMNAQATYVAPFALNQALEGGAIGEVLHSNDPAFNAGDCVLSGLGWREHFVAPGKALQKVVPASAVSLEASLGIAGLTGFTAYVGLLKLAELRDGDVVFVSAAAGAVGSAACQIAKAKGATVIGSAGGTAKREFLKSLGVDRVIDYKSAPDLEVALGAAAPNGIDVYLDNVGGAHLDAALACARPHARFAICGMISTMTDPAAGQSGIRNAIMLVRRRIRVQGFIVGEHHDWRPKFEAEMGQWLAAGTVKAHQQVFEGLEAAPAALEALLRGNNIGKVVVRLNGGDHG